MKNTHLPCGALRHVAWLAGACLWLSPSAAASRHDFHFTVHRLEGQTEISVCRIHPDVVSGYLGVANLNTELGKTVRYYIQRADGSFNNVSTLSPNGNYLDAEGHSTTRSKGVASSQYKTDASAFYVNVIQGKLALGAELTAVQGFINSATADTLLYHINIRVDGRQAIESDEPAFFHRADRTDSWAPLPYMRRNEQEPVASNCLQVQVGDKVTMGARIRNEGDDLISFSVKNHAGKLVKGFNSNDFVLDAAEASDAGEYQITVRYKTAEGRRTSLTYPFVLDVQTEPAGTPFRWEEHTPYWSYNFRDERPNGFPTPKKSHNFKKQNGQAANRVDGEWWSVFWGDNLNADCGTGDVLQKEMQNMMKKFDTDFAYIRDVMGWPPDINAREGWRSFVYVFGSGLSNDSEPNTTQGGYQSATSVDGRSWPCVWASFYPVSRFRDDADRLWNDGNYQREAMVHEGIHAIFADMEGVKQSAWFHEGGNVWLQMAMNAKRDGTYGAPGWLGVGNLICPFMPIECYSGWLQDGSFGGPSAEGVNMYGPNGQICTWRNLIGGVQYGEVFPLFLGAVVGDGAVPWIWRYCRTRVLEGIALGNAQEGIEGIGDEAMRMLIMQYRARLATIDFGGFSNGCRNLLNGSFGTVVKAEWKPYWIDVEPFALTPYQTCTLNDADGWLAPDTLTNPGWSGGNIIPIHVVGNGCVVEFRPEDSNMRCQLCYRTKDGRTFYSQPVLCGPMTLQWTTADRPANDVVFCVPCNTDYIYTGEAQRKHHYDYRIRLGEGATAVATHNQVRWYFYEQNLKDPTYTGIADLHSQPSQPAASGSADLGFRILSSVLKGGQRLQLDLNGARPSDVTAHLVGISGAVIKAQTVSPDATIQLPTSLRRGLYVLSLRHHGAIQSFKVYAE